MDPVSFNEAVSQFTERIEKRELSTNAIEAFTKSCFACLAQLSAIGHLSQFNPVIGQTLYGLAGAIEKNHPELKLLSQEIQQVAAKQKLLPDLLPLILTPAQQRMLTKQHRRQIDEQALAKLTQIEKMLPDGYFPRLERKQGVLVNPFYQWNRLHRIIMTAALHEADFTQKYAELRQKGLTHEDVPVLAQLAAWVAYKNLARFEEIVAKDKGIREIDLSGHRLSLLPPALWSYSQIRMLDISVNPLVYLPAEIALLNKLHFLNCQQTLLSSLPRQFKALQLKTLSLADTKMRSLPDWFYEMRSLKTLSLSGLRLKQLSPQIRKLNQITHLALDRNHLRELPDELVALPLIYLNISDNPMIDCPAVLFHLPRLETLVIQNLDKEDFSGLGAQNLKVSIDF